MNEGTLLSNIKTQLLNRNWTGGGSVFGNNAVAIVASIPDSIRQCLETKRTPAALVASATVESDPEFDEEPDFLRIMVDVAILNRMGGDAIGEFVMIDGALSAGSAASPGRGILTLQQQVFNAIGKLNALEGITLQFRQKMEEGAIYDSATGNWIAWRVLRFEGFGTAT